MSIKTGTIVRSIGDQGNPWAPNGTVMGGTEDGLTPVRWHGNSHITWEVWDTLLEVPDYSHIIFPVDPDQKRIDAYEWERM